jgi:hypothetical protein
MRRPGALLVAAVVAAALSLVALVVPVTAVGADAEQIVITLVDEEAPWDFDDPAQATLFTASDSSPVSSGSPSSVTRATIFG